jgi:PAS domain S-box-containing protein
MYSSRQRFLQNIASGPPAARVLLGRTSTMLALGIVYFLAARVGLAMAFLHPSATPVWPPTGIGFAAALVLGHRVWPGLFLGAFLANFVTQGTVATSLGIAIGNTVEALLGAYFVKRFANGTSVFERPFDIARFVALSAVASTAVSATIGVTTLALGGFAEWRQYPAIWLTWWLGDAVGDLVLAPPLVLWSVNRRLWPRRQAFEIALLLGVTIFGSLVIFGEFAPDRSVAFLALPILMWPAFRFGPRETATVSLLTSAMGVWSTLHGWGPFAPESPNDLLILLQAFFGVNTVAALMLAAVIHQRTVAESQLRANEHAFRAIFEQAQVGVAQIDTKTGRFLRVNQCYGDMMGLRPEEMTSITFMAITHPDDLEADLDKMRELVAGGIRLFSHEKRYCRRDGTIIWVNLTVSPMWAIGEEPNSHVEVVKDITARKEADAALRTVHHELTATLQAVRSSEARYQAMIDSALDGVVSVDNLGNITEFNPAAERMFGYRRGELIGRPMSDIVPAVGDAYVPEFARGIGASSAAVIGKIVQMSARRADGSQFPVELAVTRTGDSPLSTGYIRDVSERIQSFERFRLAIEAAPIGMITVDASGRIGLVNSQVEQLFGYARRELIGQQIEVLVPPRFRARHPDFRRGFMGDPRARPMGAGRELFGLRRDGREFPIEISLNPIDTPEGPIVLSSIIDITERKRADEERTRLLTELQTLTKDLEQRVEARTRDVRENEARYRALFNDSPISLWEADFGQVGAFLRELQSSGIGDIGQYLTANAEAVVTAATKVRILAVNRRGLELFEADNEEQLLTRFVDTLDTEGYGTFRLELQALLDGRPSFHAEVVRRTMKGRRRDISLRLMALPGYEGTWTRIVVSMVDITAAKEADQQVRDALRQQEVLLKEIHHRVKNNLAVISSLFYLESTYARDRQTIEVFEESQRRVRSMALVHETLYGSKNLAEIDFGQYAATLAGELLAAYRTRGDVKLETHAESLKVSLDLAIPCGLILNELISNALKHAFPDGRSGVIALTLRAEKNGDCVLQVTDNGAGLPDHLYPDAHRSLGLRLIRSLVRQIRGSFDFVPRPQGTEARLIFALHDDAEKP